jgi:segregation and condensation protein A
MQTNILQYAESGTYWKRIIYDIVSTEDFNPWDIDIGILTDSYLEKVKEMQMINFEVPGTIILVGSVLLKLKSDIVSGQTFIFEESLAGGEEEMDEDLVADIDDITGEPLPPSSIEDNELLVRRIPKRKVTLPELIVFLKRVVTQVEKKETTWKTEKERRIEVQVAKKNVERIMREVYREIRKLSKGEKTTFKKLVNDWNKESVVAYLMPVLHLANKDKITVEQKEIFGDIFLSANQDG